MLSHTAGVPEPPRQGRTFSSTKCRRAQDAGWKKPCAYPLRRYRGDRHRAFDYRDKDAAECLERGLFRLGGVCAGNTAVNQNVGKRIAAQPVAAVNATGYFATSV